MTVLDKVSGPASALFTTISEYADSHHDGLVALSLFVGVVITFSGRTLLRPTVFLLGFIPTTITTMALALALVHDENPTQTSLLEGVAVTISLIVGILVGVIMLRLLFGIATFVLCAGFGAVLVFVFHLFLLEPAQDQNAFFLLYAIATLAGLVSGLFSVSYPDTGIILGTSFDGSALAVFSLARFLGHQPAFSTPEEEPDDSTVWWGIGYGAATILLAVFGALTQRQVAAADEILAQAAAQKRLNNGSGLLGDPYSMSYGGENQPLLGPIEPPRTPLHMRSGMATPTAGSAYGMGDDDPKYSVVQNIGAGPLDGEGFTMNGKDLGPPLG